MTSSMRPEGLLPVERFGSAGQVSSGRGSAAWSGLPRQVGPGVARTGAGGAELPAAPPPGTPADVVPGTPETSAPPAQPDHTATASLGRAAVDGRPTPRQAPVTAPPVAPPFSRPQAPPVQGRPPAGGPPPGRTQPPQAAQAPEATQAPQAQAMPDPNDESMGSWVLVKACQAGDQDAFRELYARYQDVVFRYVLFRLGDRTLAEDLTQETFLRALRRISSVSYQGRDIGAWFVTIARNLIFDHVKSSRYRLESTTADMVEHSPTTHGPEQQVIENATNSELLKAIEKLNADQQDCIRMRFLQGLSVAETAERMNRAEGAVKALQHRAVRRLAQLMPEGLR
ncbi:RNA polymerase sigma-70 factor, TIGR02952 family [Pseudonocardia oroxyli]|uniref:RNA polymerase sigma factor n=2 Tax=Pseudonocardia oroxyli TaxID=366584 RepID=A0A1G7FYQ3_PSEOR|nr:RNA polymerase sigma-70 factor, TIGR02952 family [Pseudonocardia oroxyli]